MSETTRRSFLRGVLMTGAAAAVAPAIVESGLASADSGVAILTPNSVSGDDVPKFIVDTIVPNVVARIDAHRSLFGEMPKAMFVNRYEFRALHLAIRPLMRYQAGGLADRGIPNLIVKNVPIICVDQDTLMFDPEERTR